MYPQSIDLTGSKQKTCCIFSISGRMLAAITQQFGLSTRFAINCVISRLCATETAALYIVSRERAQRSPTVNEETQCGHVWTENTSNVSLRFRPTRQNRPRVADLENPAAECWLLPGHRIGSFRRAVSIHYFWRRGSQRRQKNQSIVDPNASRRTVRFAGVPCPA